MAATQMFTIVVKIEKKNQIDHTDVQKN